MSGRRTPQALLAWRMKTVPAPICPPLAVLMLVALFVLSGSGVALAQGVSGAGGAVDAAIDRMQSTLAHLGNNLGEAARSLLLILFTVDLVLRFGRWAIEESSFGQVFGAWLFQLAFVTMVYVLALEVPQLVDQLTGLANRFAGLAGGVEEPSASNLVTTGLKSAAGWFAEIRLFHFHTMFLYAIAALVSVIVTAMTVAFLIIAYAEIYLVGLSGIIVLGLAGLAETRSAAIAYIRLLVGKALKLMALMIVYSAISTLTTAISTDTAAGSGVSAALGAIMLQIIGALLIISLPSTVEGLVNSIGSRSAETGALIVGGVGAKGAAVAGGAAIGFLVSTVGKDLVRKLGGVLGKGAGKAVEGAASAGGKAAGSAAASAAGSGLTAATDALSGKAASDLKDRITRAMGKDS